jgi:hypothetical protein
LHEKEDEKKGLKKRWRTLFVHLFAFGGFLYLMLQLFWLWPKNLGKNRFFEFFTFPWRLSLPYASIVIGCCRIFGSVRAFFLRFPCFCGCSACKPIRSQTIDGLLPEIVPKNITTSKIVLYL